MNNATQQAEERYPYPSEIKYERKSTHRNRCEIVDDYRATFIEGWECKERQGWVKGRGLPTSSGNKSLVSKHKHNRFVVRW